MHIVFGGHPVVPYVWGTACATCICGDTSKHISRVPTAGCNILNLVSVPGSHSEIMNQSLTLNGDTGAAAPIPVRPHLPLAHAPSVHRGHCMEGRASLTQAWQSQCLYKSEQEGRSGEAQEPAGERQGLRPPAWQVPGPGLRGMGPGLAGRCSGVTASLIKGHPGPRGLCSLAGLGFPWITCFWGQSQV